MDTEQAILRFIEQHWKEKGYGPSYRDIAVAVGVASASVVKYHLVRLADRGLITYNENVGRSVRLTQSFA